MGESIRPGTERQVDHAPHDRGSSGGRSDLSLRAGKDFAGRAARLAGLSGVLFGWSPDAFWGATPVELGALVGALSGEEQAAPPDAGLIARMREAFPDG